MSFLMIGPFAAALAAFAPADYAPLPSECRPIPEISHVQHALNRFWKLSVRLCDLVEPEGNAFALPNANVVLVNREWLTEIALDYGSTAAIGILAHEWGHMVQGEVEGPAAELNADCLAGAFMRSAGFSRSQFKQFEEISLDSGDLKRGERLYGSGRERKRAVARGYRGFSVKGATRIAALCPLRFDRRTEPRRSTAWNSVR